jgi:hypothetical protein
LITLPARPAKNLLIANPLQIPWGFALWPRAWLVRLAPVRRDYPRLPLITPDYPWPGAVITSNLGSVARLARDGRNGNPLCRQRLWQMAVHQKMAVYDAGVGCTCAVRSLGLVSSGQILRRWAVCDGGVTGGRGPSTRRVLQAHCAW